MLHTVLRCRIAARPAITRATTGIHLQYDSTAVLLLAALVIGKNECCPPRECAPVHHSFAAYFELRQVGLHAQRRERMVARIIRWA